MGVSMKKSVQSVTATKDHRGNDQWNMTRMEKGLVVIGESTRSRCREVLLTKAIGSHGCEGRAHTSLECEISLSFLIKLKVQARPKRMAEHS